MIIYWVIILFTSLHMIDQFPLICDGIKKKATLEINVSPTCEFDNSATTFSKIYNSV